MNRSNTSPAAPTHLDTAEAPEAAPPAVVLEHHLPESQPSGEVAPGRIVAGGTRVATPVRRDGRMVRVRLGASSAELPVPLAPEVEIEVVDDAIERGDAVLIEVVEGEAPAVIGVLTRRRSGPSTVRGSTITVQADDEILLRAGRAALRLRSDGDVELIGSRISATSRGLFRLVGRLLRLN